MWVVPGVFSPVVIPNFDLFSVVVILHVTVFTTFRTEHTFTMVVVGVGERRTRPFLNTAGHVTVNGFSESVVTITDPVVGVGESHVGRVPTGLLIKHLDVIPCPRGMHDTGVLNPVISVITGVPVTISVGVTV